MAIRKVCGVETEYGIILRGAESNPITVSSLLINADVSPLAAEPAAAKAMGLPLDRCVCRYSTSPKSPPPLSAVAGGRGRRTGSDGRI